MKERTLTIIKPECVAKKHIGDIIQRIEQGDFKILGMKKSGRLGLGAYIARESAKYCGGDILIESKEGIGTTASIILKVNDEVPH